MKFAQNLFLLLCLMVFTSKILAQENRYYLSAGTGLGPENVILGLGGTFITKTNWGLSFNYRRNSIFRPKNLPKNYQGVLFCSFGPVCTPNDKVESFSVAVVRDFPLRKKRGSISIELGPSWGDYEIAKFTPPIDYGLAIAVLSGLLGNTYEIDYENKSITGLFLRLKRILPFGKHTGMEIAAITNFNKHKTYYGMEFYFNLGKVK